MRCFYLLLKNCIPSLLIAALFIFSCSSVSPQTPVVFLNPVIGSGLTLPVDIVSANDGTNRMFVVEQRGTVKIISNGILSGSNFLNIAPVIKAGGEMGLLSMAFHPAYSVNGYFFVYYNDVNGDVTVAQYHVSSANPNQADAASGHVLMTIPHREFSNHNGGKLNFGVDGNLYFAVGDGGSGGDPHFNAQNGNVYLGKMMRINVDNFTNAPYYTIPADNPYVSDPAVKDEIWALGLRNPFRWSFDRVTHDMWIGDVGQDKWEEVDFRPAGNTGGINYGWRCWEGNHVYNDSGCAVPGNYTPPVFEYGHNAAGGVSITGGFVYRGSDYPALYGWYTCIDYGSGNGWLIHPDGSGGWTVGAQTGLPGGIVGFGENESGEIYAVGIGSGSADGKVYKLQTSSVLPVKLQAFTVAVKDGKHELRWTTAAEQSAAQFEVEYSSNGAAFQTIGTVPATNSNRSVSYQFSYAIPAGDHAFYRLKILDANRTATYSSIVNMELSDDNAVQITPTLVRNGQLTIHLAKAFTGLQILDVNGHVVRNKALDGSMGIIYADMSGLPKGIYVVKLTGNNKQVVRRVSVQ